VEQCRIINRVFEVQRKPLLMKIFKTIFLSLFFILSIFLTGCATESHQAITPVTVDSHQTVYNGEKQVIVVGKFQNRSNYLQGIFSSGVDMMGNQAKTIVKTHLQQTGRFTVVDRDNMDNIVEEAKISGAQQKLTGAKYVLTGDVTEFGRKNTGDQQLFGILGKGKKQTAYAKVAFNIVNVSNSEIIYSAQGAGEYALSNREIVGFGGTAGYDSTLNGKVLNLAITEAVEKMVRDLEAGVWEIK